MKFKLVTDENVIERLLKEGTVEWCMDVVKNGTELELREVVEGEND